MKFPEADVVIVGAGPVGLFAALATAKNGNTVILIEKNAARPKQSRAIGIAPPSLGAIHRIGMLDRFLKSGVRVSRAGGYSEKRKLCDVDFSSLKTPYPFVLAIPQDRTEAIFETEVATNANVCFLKGAEARALTVSDDWCTVSGDLGGSPFSVRGKFIFGCDGAKSSVRTISGIRFRGAAYPHTFLMADYTDATGWGDEARLFFTPRGSVESFPLPERCRRFVVRTGSFIKENTAGFLSSEFPARCGLLPDESDKRWESAFGVQHFLAERFALPRLFLCGDAAHVISPIGGQNMNVGFADAELAAWLVTKHFKENRSPGIAASAHDRVRRRAARAALLRAELMMRLGTSGGKIWNAVRNGATVAAMRSPLASVFYGMFTMLSLPNRDLPSCEIILKKALGGVP
jgi:2-polyprenyl-6-methoxyphenol hydroxylase-like FAD-dependent oxidoreductase